MKVAFHIDQLWFNAPGGIGTYIGELLPALAHQEPGLKLVPFRSTFTHGPTRAVELAEPAVIVPGSLRRLYPSWDLLGRPALPQTLATADVVHATNPAAVPPIRRGQRLVVTIHDLAFERFPELFPRDWRWLYRAGLRAAADRADAIIVPSAATADDVASRSSFDRARIHITPLASSVATTDDDPSDDPTEALHRLGVPLPYILSVGTLEPRKNLVRLVRAFRQVAPEVPHALVLAGPPGWRVQELEAEIARPGPGTILRTGRLAGSDLDALYRGAEAFVYPSLYEGFGLPVVEAMARGVPVVTSNVSSLPEVSGDAAVLIDPEDVSEIAEALARVLTDAALADDLRYRGKERAARYTWAATARVTLDVYRHVIGAS